MTTGLFVTMPSSPPRPGSAIEIDLASAPVGFGGARRLVRALESAAPSSRGGTPLATRAPGSWRKAVRLPTSAGPSTSNHAFPKEMASARAANLVKGQFLEGEPLPGWMAK